jgi:hypothetical protein
MVDPLSITIGIGVAIAAILAGYGLYAAGQRPAYMVDMREVSRYYTETAAVEALEEDIRNDEGQT